MTKSTLKRSKILLTFGFVLVIAGCASQKSSDLSGEQIVAKMALEYANAKSYQDEGIVRTASETGSGIEEIIEFKTYFARQTRLRFEWEEKPTNDLSAAWHLVWNDDNDTFSYDIYPNLESEPVEKAETLSSGIAGASGVSHGSAHTVPSLLVKEISGFRVTEMSRISLLREEQFEGETCFVVRGFHPFAFPIDLWISKSDFLLRKTTMHADDEKEKEEEIRRNVKLNGTILDEMFHYTPPKPAAKKYSRQVV